MQLRFICHIAGWSSMAEPPDPTARVTLDELVQSNWNENAVLDANA